MRVRDDLHYINDPVRSLKMCFILSQSIIILIINLVHAMDVSEYNKHREKLIKQEEACSLGSNVVLNDREKQANTVIMNYKAEELNQSYASAHTFKFSKHYFTFKDNLEASMLYRIIRKMPKGANLHLHGTLALDVEFLLKMTYESNLYACFKDEDIKFRFSLDPPEISDQPCATKWDLLSKLRSNSGDVKAFDNELRKHFTLVTDNEDLYNADQSSLWAKFDKIHIITKPLLRYRPVREKYIRETLQRSYDDQVFYLEIRVGIHNLYELDGKEDGFEYFVRLHQEIVHKFIEENPDFLGIKLIIAHKRSSTLKDLKISLDSVRKIQAEFPDMIAGYDLVGNEDMGNSLKELFPELLEARHDINFYFHAGESNWYGSEADENLIDAYLLGTKRIGHGFALNKHPVLMTKVLKHDIALEVSVVSNNVMGHVKDFRNHPLSTFLALGLPVVLTSDSPGVWSSVPLSDDFFITFLVIASRHADLRLLKKLAINSINHSSLDSEGKKKLKYIFDGKWEKFLHDIIYELADMERRR